jgi:paraquat-inducible protein A
MALGGRRFLLGCAVVAAAVCLALGLTLPFVVLPRPVFFAYGHSLISAVNALARSSQVLLAAILLIFAILLPVLRLLYLVLLATLPATELSRSARQLRALDWLGRWSPQDILVIVLALALVATREPFAQRAASGVYFLAAAVLLPVLAHVWLPGEARAARLPASAARGAAFGVLIAVAAGTFVLGITLPALRLNEAYGGADVLSVAGAISALYARGELLLSLAILTLAVLLPGLRLLYLLTLSRALPHAVRTRAGPVAEALGRFATADTLVLTAMLFYLVASGIADAQLQPGVYALAASALLTLLAYAWANMLAPTPAQGSSLAARLARLGAASTAGKT